MVDREKRHSVLLNEKHRAQLPQVQTINLNSIFIYTHTHIYKTQSLPLLLCRKNTVKTSVHILQSLVFVTPAAISEEELHTAGKKKNAPYFPPLQGNMTRVTIKPFI